jgi:hypothetical protein
MVGVIVVVAVGAGVNVNVDVGANVSDGADVVAGAQEAKITVISKAVMNVVFFIMYLMSWFLMELLNKWQSEAVSTS